jgi:hypothetical protein
MSAPVIIILDPPPPKPRSSDPTTEAEAETIKIRIIKRPAGMSQRDVLAAALAATDGTE